MKLAVVFPVHKQYPLAQVALDSAIYNASGDTDLEYLVINNDDSEIFLPLKPPENLSVVSLAKNIGVYPVFWEALNHTDADIVAYFHSDLIVVEKDWDKRIVAAFEQEPELGLVGFIGSNEIDVAGGRGLGTCSNFQGNTYTNQGVGGEQYTWVGSVAEVHGRRVTGVEYAVVVDGCAMVFRRSVLEQIPERPDFPPHHFYDRLLSCEVREIGYKVMTMGIECDHISGQTVNQEAGYQDMAREWCEKRGIPKTHNWDDAVYHEAENQWLNEYRDKKHMIPFKV